MKIARLRQSILHFAFFTSIALVLVACKGKTEVSKPQPVSPQVEQMEQMTRFMTDITGIWSNGKNQLSITYGAGLFQFFDGDKLVMAAPVAYDPNLDVLSMVIITPETGQTATALLHRKWNSDKTAFNLVYTNTQGITEEYALLRKHNYDDLTRLMNLAKEQMPAIAPFPQPEIITSQPLIEASSMSLPEASLPTFLPPPEKLTLDNQDAIAIASQLRIINEVENTTENLTGLYGDSVQYHHRGNLSKDEVLAHKQLDIQRWPTRQYERLSDITVSPGKGANQKLASYRYRYYFSDGKKSLSGTAETQLTIARIDGRNVVIAENQKNIGAPVSKATQPNVVPMPPSVTPQPEKKTETSQPVKTIQSLPEQLKPLSMPPTDFY